MIEKVASIIGVRDIKEMTDKAGRFWAFKTLSILKAYPDVEPREIAKILGRFA